MKYSDLLFFRTIEEIPKLIAAHDARIMERLDKIERQLRPSGISPELEKAIKEVSRKALSIDQKVPDSPI